MLAQIAHLAQTYYYTDSSATSSDTSPVLIIIALAAAAFMFATMWRVFTKANKPGWAAIVPIYSIIVLLEIVNRPLWWTILFFVPFVGIIMSIVVYYDLALAFGKNGGYAALLILLPIIGFPMLAWGDARYAKPRR